MRQPRERFLREMTELERELQALGKLVDSSIERAVWALKQRALGEAQAVARYDDEIDDAAEALEEHALNLIALQGPVATDLRMVSSLIRCASELERMGDHAEGIAVLVLRSAEHPPFPLPPQIDTMAKEARLLLRAALEALMQRDPSANLRLKDHDDLVDKLYDEVFALVQEHMRADPALVSGGTYMLWMAHNLERIADRATNIAEYVEFIVRGRISSRPKE
jgi:phosphate transport system protein